MNQTKRRPFSLRFVVALTLLFATYFILAFTVNPRAHFETQIFPPIILDSRAQKMTRFRAFQGTEGLILGSSRAFKLSPKELEQLTGARFFNFAVDSGRTEDFLAIYRWSRANGAKISKLIIALDVEALHDDDTFDQRLKSNGELMRALEGNSTSFNNLHRPAELAKSIFSKPYAVDIFQSLKAAFKGTKSQRIFESDGLHQYLELDRQKTDGTFNLESRIATSRREYRWRFEGMKGLSPARKKYLESLLTEAKRDGAQVLIYITTLHPKLTESLARETKYAARLHDTRDYVAALPVATLDLSEAQFFGGNLTDWYDGAHVSAPNASLIARKLVAAFRSNGI
jgi:hypothetical protein